MQLEACAHPFFDELRDPNTRLPNGQPLPPLFNFTAQGKVIRLSCFFGGSSTKLCTTHLDVFDAELEGVSPELIHRLLPVHIKRMM